MLEDMRADFDGTKQAFGAIVRAALAEIDCGPELKERLRSAAEDVYRADWSGTSLGRGAMAMFLGWLCSDARPWLYAPEALDHYLPATVLVGLEHLSDKVPSEAAEKRRREAGRLARIERAAAALRDGWPEEDAVTFVCSREEWRTAQSEAGRGWRGQAA